MPVGLSPVPNRHSAKLFCPRCADIYDPPPDKRIDGAHFGPSFPAVFLIAFPDFDGRDRYVMPRQTIFGFKIFKDRSQTGPHGTNNHKLEFITPTETEEE